MLKEILEWLLKSRSIVIVTHVRPDGDALGSQLALGLFLKKLGKQVLMINSDPAPQSLEWMIWEKHINTFTGTLSEREAIVKADTIVIVDVNQLERIGELANTVSQHSGKKILIDHHLNPEKWFDLTYVRHDATSTGELIYDLIELYDASQIDTEIATALYTAIMTDTGSFRFDTVTADTHLILADLIQRGELEPYKIHNEVYDTRSKASLDLLSQVLGTLQLSYNNQVASMQITLPMLQGTGAHSDETDGFVNMMLSIGGVEVAVIFLELESGVKMSFRSKGRYAVNEWASKFKGGGHRNAAGAFIKGDFDEICAEVIRVAPQYLTIT